MFYFCVVRGQEFRCSVQVNSQKLMTTTQGYESTDKKVFDNMKQAIEDFVNGRQWSQFQFEQHEKIDCSISLILQQRTSATDFVAQISVQMRRPVFNSTYTTGLFNYMEQPNFSFSYNESQPLDFDPNNFYSILSSTLAYYCYVMLGIYFDSFAPYFRTLANIDVGGEKVPYWVHATGGWKTTPIPTTTPSAKPTTTTTAWAST